jgi:acylphosphatase
MVRITILGVVSGVGLRTVGAKQLKLLEGVVSSQDKTTIEFAFQTWGKQAEAIHENIKDGDQVLIDGKIEVDTFSKDNKMYINVSDLRKCSYK